ncbi:MAG: GNAT family N-acetyltransferase [Nocardioides sp.]
MTPAPSPHDAAGPIRPAQASDWPAIWEFFWPIVVAGETYAYDDNITCEQAAGLWMESPPGLTVVYEDGLPDGGPEGGPGGLHKGGRVLGSAKMGPNRPGRGAHIGTASFMVSPQARGQGVGRALAEWMIEWHRTQGYAGIQFNAVVETNVAAVGLWQALGFRIIGTVPGAFRSRAHGPVGLHVMFLELG